MISYTDGDDAAFARPHSVRHDDFYLAQEGMTKREVFAMAAAQGFCSNSILTKLPLKTLAQYAVQQADALIDALREPK